MNPAPPPHREGRYPLGTDRTELERLHLQHRLWSDAAHALWRRAGIRPGARVLDVGIGPGAAAFDLAELVTSSGRVVGVDASDAFVTYVRSEARERNVPQLTALLGDVQDLEAAGVARASFDLAYARWVLCFTRRPEDVVRGIATALAPGGVVCVHDYFGYETMTTVPRREAHARIVAATARSWRDAGGDPDVAGRLPRLFAEAGLVLEHLTVHQRLARPGETMWYWARTWWTSYAPRLVEMRYASAEDVRGLEAELDAMTSERDFLVLPPVYELMARRPR
jgi:ubiquinone/menaquinone biosynthesis C-methylase UbiE